MAHHRLCGRAKEDSTEARTAVRRNHNQIDFTFTGHAHNLGRSIAMDNNFFNIEAVEFFACGKLWQLALG